MSAEPFLEPEEPFLEPEEAGKQAASRGASIEPASKLSLFIGLSNAIAVAYVVGQFPSHYWMFHILKAGVFLSYRLILWSRSNEQGPWLVLEFCWVTNWLLLFALIYVLLSRSHCQCSW